MRFKFQEIIWEGFRSIWGIPAAILSIILTFVTWQFKPETNVSLWIIIALFSLYSLILLLLISIIIQLRKISYQPPRTITCYDTSQGIILLIEAHGLYSYDAIVSVFIIKEDYFEELIAIGAVYNIQSSGQIQILLLNIMDGQEKVVEELKNKNVTVLKKTLIKPNVSKAYLK